MSNALKFAADGGRTTSGSVQTVEPTNLTETQPDSLTVASLKNSGSDDFRAKERKAQEQALATELLLLKTVPLFTHMTQKELKALRAIMDLCVYRPGEVISSGGKGDQRFHILVTGRVDLCATDGNGQVVPVGQVDPSGFFGECELLASDAAVQTARANGTVRTLALDSGEFEDFLEKHPHAALDVLKVLSKRMAQADLILRQSLSRNANDEVDKKMAFGQRLADKVAGVIGSWKFITIQAAALACWAIWNSTPGLPHWDAYPFIFMNLALSMQAAFAAPVIMMSQNRQSVKDRISADVDHDVNVRAELQISKVIDRLEKLEQRIERNEQRGKSKK